MPTECKICGVIGPLRRSHIVPDFFLRSLQFKRRTGSAGQEQPFMILKSTRADAIDGTRQRGGWEKAVGLKEELLCAACEGRFSKYESYARGLFYGSAPPPLRKQPLGTLIPGFSVSGGPLIGARMVDHLDYRHRPPMLRNVTCIQQGGSMSVRRSRTCAPSLSFIGALPECKLDPVLKRMPERLSRAEILKLGASAKKRFGEKQPAEFVD